jgi:hypothetical protein
VSGLASRGSHLRAGHLLTARSRLERLEVGPPLPGCCQAAVCAAYCELGADPFILRWPVMAAHQQPGIFEAALGEGVISLLGRHIHVQGGWRGGSLTL